MRKTSKIIETLMLNDGELDKTIRIQGTQYDRKRVVTPDILKCINTLLKKNKSYTEISKALGVSVSAIRYNTDSVFRAKNIASTSGRHTGVDHVTISDRVAYKRQLVASGKVTA